MAVEDWNVSASLNTTVGGKNIAENSPRDELNDAIRAVMAEVKERVLDQNIWAKDYSCAFDNTTDDTTELADAITEGSATVSGAQGASVRLPRGTAILSATQNIPNRVRIIGENKRSSVLKAASGHTGPYMFTAVNGTSSMFDNALQDLTVNCNNVAGLGGILSDAWQEGGGLRNVLVQNFTTYGVRFQNGYGGAAICKIQDCEIFGSSTTAATAGIRVDQISLTGNFILSVEHSTISGDTGFAMAKGIDIVNDSLHCNVVHFEEVTTGVYLDGVGNHVLIGLTGANTVTNLVEIASTFTGSVTMIGCFRGGATNLVKDNRTAGLGTIAYDVPHLRIASEPPKGFGMIVAAGNFNGASTAPATSNCFGVSSITKSGTGDYLINMTRNGINANSFAPTVSTNNSFGYVNVALNGVNSFRIQTFSSAGAATDVNEIKFNCALVPSS